MQRKLVIPLLSMLLAATGLSQAIKVCPDQPSTTFIYVNGIWNKAGEPEQNMGKLKDAFNAYLIAPAQSGKLPTTTGVGRCSKFLVSSVDTEGWFKDLLRISGELELNKATAYASAPDNLPNEGSRIQAGVLFSWWKYIRLSANELRAYFSTKVLDYTAAQKNLNKLLTTVKAELAVGNQVVLVGHSEGNLYVQAAYDQMIKYEGVWQVQNKVFLPDTTKLVAIGISVPSDHVADRSELISREGLNSLGIPGQQRYTTYCQDFIWNFVPNSMSYTATGFYPSCAWSLWMNSILEVVGLLDKVNLLDKAPSEATLTMLASDSSLYAKITGLASQFALTAGRNIVYHKMDSYLTKDSDALKAIMFDMVSVLPIGPDLKNDQDCLFCESFNSVHGDWWKYRWGVKYDVGNIHGALGLVSDELVSTTKAQSQTLQSSQQFFGRLSLKVEFTHQALNYETPNSLTI